MAVTRTLIEVRGLTSPADQKVAAALLALDGVTRATVDGSQIEVHYDPSELTVMDLLREIRKQGFLAGML
jgi:copper chaperone